MDDFNTLAREAAKKQDEGTLDKRGKRDRLTEADKDKVVELFEHGHKQSEICEITGLAKSTVSRICNSSRLSAYRDKQADKVEAVEVQEDKKGLIADLEGCVRKLTDERDELRQRVKELTTQTGEQLAQIAQLTNQRDEAREEIGKLSADISGLMETNADLMGENAYYISQFKDAQAELNELKTPETTRGAYTYTINDSVVCGIDDILAKLASVSNTSDGCDSVAEANYTIGYMSAGVDSALVMLRQLRQQVLDNG